MTLPDRFAPHADVPAPPLAWWRLRVRGSALALRAQLRRWAGFIVVVAAVLGSYFTTLIGWPALPLFWALQQVSAGQLLLGAVGVMGHAAPAVLLCWALRAALLPARWLEAEAALPLRRAQRLAADLAVLALAQAPWVLLTVVSFAAWRLDNPLWARSLWPGAALAFVLSLVLSIAAGCVLLHLYRSRLRPGRAAPAHPTRSSVGGALPSASGGMAAGRPVVVAAGVWWSLLAVPLWRGPARPVSWALGLGLSGALLSLMLAGIWPAQASWALAAYTLVLMSSSAYAHAVALRCYGASRQACRVLSMRDEYWARHLRVLALVPAGVASLGLVGLLWFGPWHLAPRAAPLFVLGNWVAPALALGFDGGSAELRAGRWLLIWGLWVALASEALL